MKHLKVGNVAFWRHDQFPFFLHGTIEEIGRAGLYPGRGFVITKEYGKMWFSPVFCLPLNKAGILISDLEAVANERNALIDAVKKSTRFRLQHMLPKGVKLP